MATINTIFENPKTRPCWVDGRRAMFHRWTDSARPVKPRGMEEDEAADRYQLHSVHALVEYEDGTMERVWPNTVRFADSETQFSEYDWETAEKRRDGELPFTYNGLDLDAAGVKIEPPTRTCLTCGASPVRENCGFLCRECAEQGCRCRHCNSSSLWILNGAANE